MNTPGSEFRSETGTFAKEGNEISILSWRKWLPSKSCFLISHRLHEHMNVASACFGLGRTLQVLLLLLAAKKARIGVLFCILLEAGKEDGHAGTEPDFWRNRHRERGKSDHRFGDQRRNPVWVRYEEEYTRKSLYALSCRLSMVFPIFAARESSHPRGHLIRLWRSLQQRHDLAAIAICQHRQTELDRHMNPERHV